jgi:hypothetical protein
LGDLDKPLGMSDAEFSESRARHAAGERTLFEAENEAQSGKPDNDNVDEIQPDADVGVSDAETLQMTA